MSLIVYNTPFKCENTCPGCYLLGTHNATSTEILAGHANLAVHLHLDKEAELVMAVSRNEASYVDADQALKSVSDNLDKREVTLLVNDIGTPTKFVQDMIDNHPIAELDVTVRPGNISRILQEVTGIVNRNIFLTVDNESEEDIMYTINNHHNVSSIYVLITLDKKEMQTMDRMRKYIGMLSKLIIDDPRIVLSPCLGSIGKGSKFCEYGGYTEITGSRVITGCPYNLHEECRKAGGTN